DVGRGEHRKERADRGEPPCAELPTARVGSCDVQKAQFGAILVCREVTMPADRFGPVERRRMAAAGWRGTDQWCGRIAVDRDVQLTERPRQTDDEVGGTFAP